MCEPRQSVFGDVLTIVFFSALQSCFLVPRQHQKNLPCGAKRGGGTPPNPPRGANTGIFLAETLPGTPSLMINVGCFPRCFLSVCYFFNYYILVIILLFNRVHLMVP